MDAILAYQPKEEEDFYGLLGCDELSSTEQILAEYKIRAKALHPDKNVENVDSTKKFANIQRAKEILCDPSLRAKYDQWRRSGIAVTFEDWMSKQELVQMSMHWASQKPKQPALESATGSINQTHSVSRESSAEQSDRVSIKERFRTYQI